MSMSVRVIVLLSVAALCAAAGQMFLKLGATGASAPFDYLNWRIGVGLVLYALSTLLWIAGLSAAPLSAVYGFTALTFVLVYVGSILVLGERLTMSAIAGCSMILLGLAALLVGQR